MKPAAVMQALDATRVPLLGCNLIEASAGCGKTHSITTLFVRLVVEQGLEVGQVLVVTYTRAATAELRDRVRRRLREALDCLSASQAPSAAHEELWGYFTERSSERASDERRLQAALRDFDEAAILTIHAFCQRVLADHAFESGSPFEARFIEDVLPLVDDVGRDFWARRFYTASPLEVRAAQQGKARPSELIELGRRVHGAPGLHVLPEGAAPADREAQLSAAWYAARDEAAAEWARDAPALTAFVTAGYLNKQSHNPAKLLRWCEQMADLGAVEPPGVPECVAKFTSSVLREKLNKDYKQQRVDRPAFLACERWLQVDQELQQFLTARTLATRREFVDYVRHEVGARKQRQGLTGFDDLLHALGAALDGPSGQALAEGVRARHRAALIDEFQDTDPVQYAIFRRLFAHDERPLFLIGDPKQAIYAFRGADVFAYMEAARSTARARWGLTRNYRSDPGLIAALEGLFARLPDPFLHPGIDFARVEARPGAVDALVRNGEPLPPLELLFAHRGDDSSAVNKGHAERVLPARVAAEIDALLRSGATLQSGGPETRPEPVQARHVAVLCRTNRQAASMQQALRDFGIPSVLEGDSSVFDTAPCEELQRVLAATAQPGDAGKLRAALATNLFGVDAEALARMHAGEDPAWDHWVAAFGEWNRVWRERGFIQAFHRMLDEGEVQQRLLARVDGQRQLTDLLHLGELLHSAAVSGHLGPLSLLHWLSQMRLDEDRRGALTGESEQVRLESDEHAVRLTTIHKSKGLEYPIVYCPFLWTGPFTNNRGYSLFHDVVSEGAPLCLDLGSDHARRHASWQEAEELTESLRLMYVALTRARHRCSVIWGHFRAAEKSPLAHLLHADSDVTPRDGFDGDGINARVAQTAADVKAAGKAGALRGQINSLAARTPGVLVRTLPLSAAAAAGAGVEWSLPTARNADPASAAAAAALAPRVTDRRLPRHHRISSFSALTARVGHAPSALADEGLDLDEQALPGAEHADDAAASSAALEPPGAVADRVRLHDFPRGARAGNLIHHVYEHLDFRGSRAELDAQVADSLQRFGFIGERGARLRAPLADALAASLATPLSASEPTIKLGSLARADRLDELEFLLPVAESPSARWLTAVSLAAAFEAHDAPVASPEYFASVRKLPFLALSGYLKGYVDLVFRHEGRYFIVDYKSNHLGDHAADYAPARLPAVMEEAHYYLQYHLYSVALHRHLAQRLGAHYDHARHFGGVFYLFVRGLSPEHPVGTGVFADRPSLRLLEALSRALSNPGAQP
jgi:exodeoxyribonuclease V beta subunit